MRSLQGLFLAAGALGVLWIGLFLPRRAPLLVAPRVSTEASLGRPTLVGSARREAPLAVAPEVLADVGDEVHLETALADYWGARWGEVRPALIAAGVDLDSRRRLPRWEEVAPHFKERLTEIRPASKAGMIQNHLRYPDALTLEWVETHLGLPDGFRAEDLGYLEEIALPLNVRAQELATRYVEYLEYALEDLWASGRYLRAPISTAGAPSPYTGNRFYSRSLSLGAWTATIGIEHGAFPHLDALRNRLESLREERDDALRRYLAGYR